MTKERTPQVSVIMPAYKAAGTIVESVRSVLAQTYIDWELLIAADDDTNYQNILAAAKIEDSRIRFGKTHATACGPSVARNVGIDMAKGSVLAFLDSDDLFLPQKLEVLLPPAQEFGLAVDNMTAVLPDSDRRLMAFSLPQNAVVGMAFFSGINIPVWPLLRRDSAPRFREDVAFSEDFAFLIDACEANGLKGWATPQSYHLYVLRKDSYTGGSTNGDMADRAYRAFAAGKSPFLAKAAARKAALNQEFAHSGYVSFMDFLYARQHDAV